MWWSICVASCAICSSDSSGFPITLIIESVMMMSGFHRHYRFRAEFLVAVVGGYVLQLQQFEDVVHQRVSPGRHPVFAVEIDRPYRLDRVHRRPESIEACAEVARDLLIHQPRRQRRRGGSRRRRRLRRGGGCGRRCRFGATAPGQEEQHRQRHSYEGGHCNRARSARPLPRRALTHALKRVAPLPEGEGIRLGHPERCFDYASGSAQHDSAWAFS